MCLISSNVSWRSGLNFLKGKLEDVPNFLKGKLEDVPDFLKGKLGELS